jgi:NAD(P)-dependent dehydrogenase (short-subunit alcohol dehydrogenase family)
VNSLSRWALVTGGSRGIGRAVALELARTGWDVAIVHLRNADAAADTVNAVHALGQQCVAYQANIGKPDECADVVRRVGAECGALTGLVHAAGLGALSPTLATRPARWQIAWDTHLGGLLALASAAQPIFVDSAGIVAFSSLGAWRVMPGYASIGAAKGALESAVRYLAAELAPRVTVNVIRGGPIDTDSLRSFTFFDDIDAESRRRPPGRLGLPEDIAPVAAYLLGPGARWITGQVITADGGFGLH